MRKTLALLVLAVLLSGCVSQDMQQEEAPEVEFEPTTIGLGNSDYYVGMITPVGWDTWVDDFSVVISSKSGGNRNIAIFYFSNEDDDLDSNMAYFNGRLQADNDTTYDFDAHTGIENASVGNMDARVIKYSFMEKAGGPRTYSETYWVGLDSGFAVIQYKEFSDDTDFVRNAARLSFNSISINRLPTTTSLAGQ